MNTATPILYSYRRCPYAMRARMAIGLSSLAVEQREIVFWDKPEPMLQASPKGTVPVLILPNGDVIDESIDIVSWAFKHQRDGGVNLTRFESGASHWVDTNDGEFKDALDNYKYADRHPENDPIVYRQAGEVFLKQCDEQLAQTDYLLGNGLSDVDIAIFPFIRQFANVDKMWWEGKPYPHLSRWLKTHLQANYFIDIMKNRPVWQPNHQPLWVDEPSLLTKDQFSAKAMALALN